MITEPGTEHNQNPKPSKAHRKMLFEDSDISPEVAAERPYFTARTGADVPQDRGKLPKKPGLMMSTYSPDGITRSYQLRPDRKGSGPKYWSPAGRRVVVDVHPRMIEEVRHGDKPIVITEGVKTGDAATSKGIPTLVLAGVDMWSVPKVKPKQLRPCFDHVRLEGRLVYVCFDSDCMTKENVQRALGELVTALEERGAVVRVIYLPDAPDGSKQGIDDFYAAGGTTKEMFMLAREFEPADIGEIRMSRDDRLRASVDYLWRDWYGRDWMQFVGNAERGNWQRGHTARDVKEAMIQLATRHGQVDDRGIVLTSGLRTIADKSAKSCTAAGAAVAHLAADGQIKILPAEDKSKPRSYRLLVSSEAARATLDSMERVDASVEGVEEDARTGERDGGARRCQGLRAPSDTPTAPRLRWSSPGRYRQREFEVVPGRPVVRSTGAPPLDEQEERPYIKRLCPHRGAVLDTLEAAGGELHLEGLCEALHRKRPRDVRRRMLPMLEAAGIIEVENDVIRLAAEWVDKLEEERERAGEIEQAEEQAKKHRKQRALYREHLEREKRGTPQASYDAARHTKKIREKRLREIAAEDERDLASTPPEVKVFVEQMLGQHNRIRLELLCEVAQDRGLRRRDVPVAVQRMGYRIERLPEYEDAEFVYGERVAA